MRYKLTVAPKFLVDGTVTHNMLGSLVLFTDGIAYLSDPTLVDYAKKLHFLSSVEPVVEEVIKEVIVEESVIEEHQGALDVDVITTVGTGSFQPPEEGVVDEDVVSIVSSGSFTLPAEFDETPTAEEITSLYEELKTWSAVAEKLGISTSTLRKYREVHNLL
jgi:hypothetical protein